ncbi:MAG: phosphate ABC transporter ATP-binding protein PstB [Methanomassiliicoccales archaeon]
MSTDAEIKIAIEDLCVDYGGNPALTDVSMRIPERSVTAIIGPSGCGKSTLVRSLNRINDMVPICNIQGEAWMDGENILSRETDLVELRRKVGMVFQKPNPFPFSVFDNVAYGCRMAGIKRRRLLETVVRRSLEKAALYEELKDRLEDDATALSGGQQQRVCIARALAMEPEVLLMDEPCSSLDPIATKRIEDLIREIREEYTVVVVTHNMEQALRVSDYAAFLYMGKLVEFGETTKMFESPNEPMTKDYLEGRMG